MVSMQNPVHTLADTLGAPAAYMGQNAAGQFLFASGAPIPTHLFNDLSEAVTRFGRRIDTRATEFKHSAQFSDGRKDAAAKKPFSPPDSKRFGAQAVLEYGHGYLAGLLDALPAAVKSPVLTEAEHNAMMKRGRR